VTEASQHIRFRGRSFPVLAIEPETPLADWIERLDTHIARAPSFFSNKPIVVDVSGLGLPRSGLANLVKDLSTRGIRILGLTGVEASWACSELPPVLVGGRATKNNSSETSGKSEANSSEPAAAQAEGEGAGLLPLAMRDVSLKPLPPRPAKAGANEAANQPPLIVQEPVRSGQSIAYPDGDVTVVGSVASGAEVIAGGSVHVYGILRGRALAGAYGEMRARIFCRRFEAELLAIGGFYITADEIEENVRGQAIQAWLENDSIKIARLD
jgi:septum site-determining protein MinC